MSTTGYNCQPQICRLCLASTTTRTSLIAEGEISRMLEAVTSLKISPEDDISTIACLKCVLNLKLAYIIQQNMLGAERRFRQRQMDRIKEETSLEENSELIIKEEIEEEHSEQDFTLDPVQNSELYYCDICSAALSSELHLERHRFRFHPNKAASKEQEVRDNIESRVGSISGQEDLTGDISGAKTCSEWRPRQYKRTVCENVSFQCKFCAKTFKYINNKSKHEQNCAGPSPKPGKVKKPKPDDQGQQKSYTCDDCGKNTSSSDRLRQHKYRTHLREKCPVCHELVAKDNIKRHMERHENIAAVCELCGASVKSTNLTAHIRRNHKNPAHKCKFCDKTFKIRRLMLYHQKKDHLKQADFVCDTCGKTFYQKLHLQKHIQSRHLQLRPHVCKFCDVGFSTKYAMVTHQRKHTNETPYKCEVCGEGFRYNVTLKAHLKSKHNVEDELTCECKVCGKKFASQAALTSHGRIH